MDAVENAASGNGGCAGNEARPDMENRLENTIEPSPDTINHANELQAHKFTPPKTGSAATDKTYQQQQDKLAVKEAQDHEKLQQQQEKEHQQATQKNYNDVPRQQMEQRHTHQT